MEAQKKESSQWWWFESQNKGNSNRSPWLQSTLAELDQKTKTMLKLIEEDADSFAQRAEMYYRKRPELISMVEDFYRTHRSLAERHEQAKSEPLARLPSSPWSPSSPLSFTKFRLQKPLNLDEKAYDSYSEEAYGQNESDESEVDDPDEEEVLPNHVNCEAEEVSSGDNNEELIVRLKEEIEKLREENEAQKAQLMQKDEEKREVIRQLSLGMDLLRDENAGLRQLLPGKNTCTPKKENRAVSNKGKEGFFGRVFSGFGKSPSNVVAL